MTSDEILALIKQTTEAQSVYDNLRQILSLADFVKFAKASAYDEENAAALPAAVRFVTVTYQSQLAE